MNRSAQQELQCESRLEVVPRAGHLFEEPGVTLANNHALDYGEGALLDTGRYLGGGGNRSGGGGARSGGGRWSIGYPHIG